jgi:uncharacterized membrane protein
MKLKIRPHQLYFPVAIAVAGMYRLLSAFGIPMVNALVLMIEVVCGCLVVFLLILQIRKKALGNRHKKMERALAIIRESSKKCELN